MRFTMTSTTDDATGIDPAARAEFEAGLKKAAITRHGDSNDAEIGALTALADMAETHIASPDADLADALRRAREAANGDSNDAEIESLWEVAELAAAVFEVDYDAIDDAAHDAIYG
jgi:hypothetical protein